MAGSFIAILCATLGTFLVLRRFSLIGDGLAHVTFGGVAVGLFLNVYPIYAAEKAERVRGGIRRTSRCRNVRPPPQPAARRAQGFGRSKSRAFAFARSGCILIPARG